MYAVAMSAVLATMVLALSRAILGPTVYDRILAVSMAGTKTLLLIAVLGFLTRRHSGARQPGSLLLDEIDRSVGPKRGSRGTDDEFAVRVR